MENIKITTEYIELGKLLKILDFTSSGGEAKYFLKENNVYVDGIKEERRGRKIYPGSSVKINNKIFKIE